MGEMSQNRNRRQSEQLETFFLHNLDWSGVFTGRSALVQFALVWWLTITTGSATVLATASLVALLPQVLLGPFAGALVDRWNRRLVMIAADSFTALGALALAYLFATGQVQIWHVYAVMFLRSLAASFQWPAMAASTSLMVPEEHLARVAGLNQGLQGVMSIAAPPLGALLLGVLPIHGVLLIDVATAALAVLPLLFVAVPQPAPRAAAERTSLLADVHAAVQYVWRWPGMIALLIMAALINFLLNPGFALAPLLVTRHFHGGAPEVAWFESIFGVGVIAGSIILSVWGGFRRRMLTALVGLIGMGLGITVLGFAPENGLFIALAALFAVGLANPIANGPLQALLQANVEPDMQGRVFMLVGSLSAGMAPIGMAIAGPAADVWRADLFVIGGITCLLMAVIAYAVPAIFNLEEHMRRTTAEPRPRPSPCRWNRNPTGARPC
jgi:DHA3 family macrolide efflux protein-like MFS transporter